MFLDFWNFENKHGAAVNLCIQKVWFRAPTPVQVSGAMVTICVNDVPRIRNSSVAWLRRLHSSVPGKARDLDSKVTF